MDKEKMTNRTGHCLDLASIEKGGELVYWPALGRPYKNHANRNLKISASVVSLFGDMGYLVIIPFTEAWLARITKNSDVSKQLDFLADNIADFAEIFRDSMIKECSPHESNCKMLTGINTRPDGHELMYFIDWNNPDLFRIIYHYAYDQVYAMAKDFLKPVMPTITVEKKEDE